MGKFCNPGLHPEKRAKASLKARELLPKVTWGLREFSCPFKAHTSWLQDRVMGMVLRGKMNSGQFWASLFSLCPNWSLFSPNQPTWALIRTSGSPDTQVQPQKYQGGLGRYQICSCWHSFQWLVNETFWAESLTWQVVLALWFLWVLI